jgi:hypothetical protein
LGPLAIPRSAAEQTKEAQFEFFFFFTRNRSPFCCDLEEVIRWELGSITQRTNDPIAAFLLLYFVYE